MKRLFIVLLAAAALFAGCDAIKGLFGEEYGANGGGDISVAFEGVTVAPNGTTTLVSLVFDRDIDGLSESDVAIVGAEKGVLSPTGSAGVYTLAVHGVNAAGEITVSVGKSGYTFSPASRTAPVYFDQNAAPVTFSEARANGTAGSQTSAALTLVFSQAIDGLGVNDITLWAGSTGAVKGTLSAPNSAGQGTGVAYTLGLNSVTAAGDITVTVLKSDWTVNPATIRVPVHYHIPGPATGGDIAYKPVEGDPSKVWEIHTFKELGTHSLTFDTAISSVTADYLIVAGGGGSGGDKFGTSSAYDYAGGGGAGGLLYKTGVELPLANGTVQVTVGAGGEGGQTMTQGANGGDSAIGNIVVFGGGGGGGAAGNLDGKNGGSGGGSGSGSGTSTGKAGSRTSDIAVGIKGNNGGRSYSNNGADRGAGGGGAESEGQNATSGAAGEGGDPWIAAYNNASWISTVTGTAEFSRGGGGGSEVRPEGGAAGAQYGDGGSAGKNTQQQGGNGHGGIVVIRFQRPN